MNSNGEIIKNNEAIIKELPQGYTDNFRDPKVFKDNKELELSTITFALLMALVEGHGRVLTRDYLLMLIEDITGHVVEDNTLTAHLKRLRQTLGEYQNRKYIETLRGVGYRWKI